MSRSGYSDDYEDDWQMICWSGAVQSAIRGKRGQAFLRELAAALDAMPVRQLIAHDLDTLQGCCALGAVGRTRKLNLSAYDPDDPDVADQLADKFGIAPALAREITFWNDEAGSWKETPEQRWLRVRAWVGREMKS